MALINSVTSTISSISSSLLQVVSLETPSALKVNDSLLQSAVDTQDIVTPQLLNKAKAAKDIKQYQAIDKAASDGLTFIRNSIEQLTSLAAQASSGALSTSQQASLNKQFQSEYRSLQKFVANDSVDGQKLFTGNFSLSAGGTLGQYLFTGASNEPTQAQATLSLPNILASFGTLSIADSSDAASALTTLENTAQSLNPIAQNIGDFSSALTFASNTLQGKPNNGASITQEDALGQATGIAGAAAAGISDITSLVQQLESIATEAANPALSSTQSGFLNQYFGSVLQGINQVVNNLVGPDGTPLLNGSLNDNIGTVLGQYLFTGAANAPTAADADLTIGNLGTSGLFGSSLPDVNTQADAQNALATLSNALQTLNAAAASVGNFEYALNFASNNINAVSNASASTELVATSAASNDSVTSPAVLASSITDDSYVLPENSTLSKANSSQTFILQSDALNITTELLGARVVGKNTPVNIVA